MKNRKKTNEIQIGKSIFVLTQETIYFEVWRLVRKRYVFIGQTKTYDGAMRLIVEELAAK